MNKRDNLIISEMFQNCNSNVLKSNLLFIVIITLSFTLTLIDDANARTYNVYVAPMPKNWEAGFKDVLPTAMQFWKDNIPNLDFKLVSTPEQSDFVIQWASTYKGNKLGYWTPFTNNDYQKPYLTITLGFFEDNDWVLVDWKYATLIATHELGHAIGFGHSDNPNSIMYPSIVEYQYWKSNFEAKLDDSYYFKKSDQEELKNYFDEYSLNNFQTVITDVLGVTPSNFIYALDDNIPILGQVYEQKKSLPVYLTIKNPEGKITYEDSFVPDQKGDFKRVVLASGPRWYPAGMYEISATYDGSTAKSGFFFLGQLDADFTSSTADITIDNKISQIISIGAGVTVDDYDLNEEFSSLILGVDPFEPPYVIELVISRSILDSKKVDNQDDEFIIISGNGNKIPYVELLSSDDSRIILFQIQNDEDTVEIIGTNIGNVATASQTLEYESVPKSMYQNDEYGFTIEYPSNFKVTENYSSEIIGGKGIVRFENEDYYISIPRKITLPATSSDESYFAKMSEEPREWCESKTILKDGFDCSYVILKKEVIEVNGKRTYSLIDGLSFDEVPDSAYDDSRQVCQVYHVIDFDKNWEVVGCVSYFDEVVDTNPISLISAELRLKEITKFLNTFTILEDIIASTNKPMDAQDKLAPFVDPEKDSWHYVERYRNESKYREWFDKNYPEYSSIYQAVGLKEPLDFVDSAKDPQHYIGRYNNEPKYREWFDKNFPDYTIYEAVGIPNPQKQLPSWIKNNAGWWADKQIDDQAFVNGIQYLIKNNIIQVSETQQSSSLNNEIPDWIRNNAKWWADGMITDDDFVKGIEYLISNGIILVE